MMRKKQAFLLLLIILALFPYFLACFCAMPFADDFCYAWTSSEKISFVQRFLRQYLFWSGRYSAHVLLCNHPLTSGKLLYYQLGDFASLTLLWLAAFALTLQFLKDLWKEAIAASLVLLFYLCYMPQLAEGVYWYTGVCNYALGDACMALHFALFIASRRRRNGVRLFYLFLAAVTLFAAIGFNEVGAALIPVYYVLLAFLTSRSRGAYNVHAKIFLALALLCAALVIFSPGNLVRAAQFQKPPNIWHAAFYSALQTGRFAAQWLFNIPAIILSVVVLAKADEWPDSPITNVDYKQIIALLVFTLFLSAFIPYCTTGILGQHRTINYAFFLVILLWLWFLISVSKRYLIHLKLNSTLPVNALAALMAASVLIMSLTGNGGNLLHDFSTGKFSAYRQEFLYRQQSILKNPEAGIAALNDVPVSFQIVDARNDSTWWVDKCMKFYYRDTRLELK